MPGRARDEITLRLLGAEKANVHDGVTDVRLLTDQGAIACRRHDALAGESGIVWVFGAGGGFFGPAGGLYDRLGRQLAPEGIVSLEVAYRRPGDLTGCVLDTLAGVEHLRDQGRTRIVVVGHSFGGAVVINAAVLSDAVVAVAALRSQTYGADAVTKLGRKPLFLAHGEADEVLPATCSRSLFARAHGPKEMKLYPGCRHGLDDCREDLDRDLTDWLRRVLPNSKPEA